MNRDAFGCPHCYYSTDDLDEMDEHRKERHPREHERRQKLLADDSLDEVRTDQ